MKKLLFKILFLICAVVISFCIITLLAFKFVLPEFTSSYMASLNEKVERLKSIDEPKIVLIGNSNLAFGMDSKRLEDAINMPVVNMGYHGGLGNSFHEEMAKLEINKGDLVIICHTSYSDDDSIHDTLLAWTAIEDNFQLWKLIGTEDLMKMLKAFPNYLYLSYYRWITNSDKTPIENCYTSSAFNKYGDIEYSRPYCEYVFNENSVTVPEINDICVNRINNLNEYLSSRGATLLIAGYPIGYGKFTPEKSKFILFQENLERQLDCEVISDFTDYFIDYKYFFNTQLHLNDEGVEIRTNFLINDIKEWKIKEYKLIERKISINPARKFKLFEQIWLGFHTIFHRQEHSL